MKKEGATDNGLTADGLDVSVIYLWCDTRLGAPAGGATCSSCRVAFGSYSEVSFSRYVFLVSRE